MKVTKSDSASWWSRHVVRGFQKSWSWIASVAGFVLAVGPDLANLALTNMGMIATVFPEMSLRQKAVILLCANVLSIVLRPVKQPRAMRPDEGATIPVAVIQVPDTVSMGRGGPSVATEIERIKNDPDPPS